MSAKVQRQRFTEVDAQTKVGKQIRSLIPFSAVPQGTTGTVISADELAGGYDVVIEWDLPKHPYGKPLRDWFTKDEYERFLEEIYD